MGKPGSSIDGAASSVVLYQKYSVAEDFTHSGTLVLFISGQDDHGSGYFKTISSSFQFPTRKQYFTYPETVEQIVKTPGDNDVVIQSHEEGNDARRYSDATQPGMYGIPHAQGTQSHFLSNSKFY